MKRKKNSWENLNIENWTASSGISNLSSLYDKDTTSSYVQWPINDTDYVEYTIEYEGSCITEIIASGVSNTTKQGYFKPTYYYGYANLYVYGIDNNDNETLLGITSGAQADANYTTSLTIDSQIKYKKLKFKINNLGSNQPRISEIRIFGYYNSIAYETKAYQKNNVIKAINLYREYIRSKRFNYANDSFQEWVVPSSINKIHVEMAAVKGITGQGVDYIGTGGNGGIVECDLTVTPGQTLYFYVGKYIQYKTGSDIYTASYNASDIRTNNTGITDATSLQSRLIVAGAGGNGGNTYNANYAGNGGDGGGLTADNGSTSDSGKGGTQEAGGNGGAGASGSGGGGSFGKGGNGSACSKSGNSPYNVGGGGGGSSYTDANLCSNVIHTKGGNDGVGYIIISTVNDTDYFSYKDHLGMVKF